MSHLVMRMGDLLHFHPFAHGLSRVQVAPSAEARPRNVEPLSTSPPDDLSFFSLSVEHKVVDRRSDLDRLGLIGLGDMDVAEID